jgi:2-methylcitrate dehydratase PrpD
VDGQFSANYSVAIACLEKKAFLEEYTEESIRRTDVAELMKKIDVKHNPDLDKFFPQLFLTKVTITMDDGRTFVKEVRYPKGDPENPLSWEELLQKFDHCVATSGLRKDKKEQIVEYVMNLEKSTNLRDFFELLH